MPNELVGVTAPAAQAAMGRPESAAARSIGILQDSKSAGPSFAQRKAQTPLHTKSNIIQGNNMMRDIDRPPPGDAFWWRKPLPHPEVGKKKSAYFETEFAAPNRDADPIRAQVQGESMVMAELRTNVIIKDELSFITDLSYQLSNRYKRPMSSIVVHLSHGCCMMFGGSFDPAYTLTVHALPSLLQPTTNKRNALLIQQHLQESLGVVSSRGFVRFVASAEDDVAVGGKTIAAQIDEMSKTDSEDRNGVFRKPSKTRRRLSVKSLKHFKAPPSAIEPIPEAPRPSGHRSGENVQIATIPEKTPPTPPADNELAPGPNKIASRRKSMMFSLFGSKAYTDDGRPNRSVAAP